MSGPVINLADRRPPAGDEPAICPCGSWYWVLRSNHERCPEHGALTLRSNGTVSGYAGWPHCQACGLRWTPA
ncbi:hypothetical protein ACFRCG_39765 [Embleya sp. NPDC056575]|uniref:hypothetical protein n=1 Tax=unclassified Embleya TaxID=2699296 RepID=UPI0036914467